MSANGKAAAILETSELRMVFGGLVAVDGVDFTVPEGAIVSVIGPNGAGKTTCFNLLTKFLQPTSGRIVYNGRDITREKPSSIARLGLIRSFQISAVFPHLSVLENVALGPRVVGRMPLAEARARAAAQLERVGMASFAAARPETLSGGQQQRVAIARALALTPRVMLFDEPTSALDPAMSAEVMETIVALARGGQTMVVVTHDHTFARRAATQVVELVAGRITRAGPPATVLDP